MDNYQGNNSQGAYTYYQNMYNMFGGINPIVDKSTRELKKLGVLCGSAVIGFSVFQYLVVFFLNSFGLYERFQNDLIFQHGIGAIAPIVYVFLPFFIIFMTFKPAEREKILAYDKPKSPQLFVLAVFAGLMICFLGDNLTSVISSVISIAGVEFKSPDFNIPSDPLGIFLLVVECAVVPALVEEFALRGVVLTPLRKYGDWFAIVISSLIFSLMHGNMVQIPFAFIAGLALGYFRIATGSIWTSVVIHFLNNLFSVAISVFYSSNKEASFIPYTIISGAVFIIGIFALIVFARSSQTRMKRDKSGVDKSIKAAAYMCTPTVVIGIAFSIYSTLLYTSTTSALGIVVLLALVSLVAFFILRGIGIINKDNRIAHSSTYTASIVITIFGLIISVYLIFAMSFKGRVF